jgi:NSS family neurotransmitter:Na+ symporter
MSEREQWITKTGFIMAAVGSAIGLGNIWGFPWRLSQFGGGTFLLIYLFLVIAIATTGAVMELSFGRSQKRSIFGVYENTLVGRFGKNKKIIGTLFGIVPMVGMLALAFFYMVVVGWVLKYFFMSLQGAFYGLDTSAFFGDFAGSGETVLWLMLALLINGAILYFGVQKGIEKVNKIFMPLLFIMMIVLAIRSVTLPGAMEGVIFMLTPDWSMITNINAWRMALGQAFFSVSLFGAAIVLYGSYLGDNNNIHKSAFQIAGLDTMAALLAAFIIIPTAFAFNIDVGAGPGLLFITLPELFTMMPGGYFFGVTFFLLVLIASFSSSVSIIELPVDAVMDKFNFSRRRSVLAVSVFCLLGGIPLALDMNLFGNVVDIVTKYLGPIGAILAAITFFWIYDAKDSMCAMNTGSTWDLFKKKGYYYYGKYIFVIAVTIILISGLL